MKALHHLLILLSLFSAAASVSAQVRFEPRQGWPYLMADFSEGTLCTRDGSLLKTAEVNICIVDGKLHFIDKGVVMQADPRQVYTVRIGEEVYVNNLGRMMQLVSENERGAVLRETYVDLDEMGKTDIGYGIKSSTASSTHLNAIGDDGVAMINLTLNEAISKRNEGRIYPTGERLFFLIGLRSVPATRNDVLAVPGMDKEAAKRLFKEKKVRWSRAETLLPVVDLLAETLLKSE